jgi:hypothetical protein
MTPKNLQMHTTPPAGFAGLRAIDKAGHRSPAAFSQVAA